MVKAFNYKPKEERICHRGHVITRGSHRVTYGRPNFLGCRECRKIEKAAFRDNNPLWDIWSNMRRRCYKPNYPKYKDYGARGITICEAWQSYEQFAKDMGERPTKQHSIGRIDNDGNYCPENCQWELPDKQGLNKRNNHRYEHNGQNLTARQWSKITGVPAKTFEARIRYGWTIAEALIFEHREPTAS